MDCTNIDNLQILFISCLSNDNCFEFFVAFCNPYNCTTILVDCAMIRKIVTELQNQFFIALRWFFCACHYNLKSHCIWIWKDFKEVEDAFFLFQISNNILQSCHNRNGLQKIKLDCVRIAKHKNIWFLLFWLCTDLNGSIHVWTQISPSIATLLCIDIGTTYKHNPPVIFIDCVGIVWIV